MENVKNEVKAIVREHLEQITRETAPFLYSLQKGYGYERAEELILRYAVKNRVSIAAAIAQIEAEME